MQALRHGQLPATLHVDAPSPHVDWTSGAVRLLTDPVDWPAAAATDRPRRAAISAFGISGTNAHLILEEPPAEPDPTAAHASAPRSDVPAVLPWVLGAHSAAALRAQATRLAERVAAGADLPGSPSTTDVGHALAVGRAALEHRAVVVADSVEEFLTGLRAIAADVPAGHAVTGVAAPATGRTAFLFTGQGSQRAGAGRELYARFGVFADALDEVAGPLDIAVGRSVRELLFAEPGSPAAADLDATAYTQPALFALEVALYRLVESFGLRADRLIGHSVGELSAAHVAGVFSLSDAATLVAARGRLMQSVPATGAMAALEGTEAEIERLLADAADAAGTVGTVGIAAVNGPRSVVISGDREAVESLAGRWRDAGHRAKTLRVSHAFHSAHLDPVLDEYRRVLSRVTLRPPTIPIISNVTGEVATDAELTDPDYWVRHLRGAIRFHDGVRTLADQGVTTYVELGPDAVLAALAEQTLADAAPTGAGPAGGAPGAGAPGPAAPVPPVVVALLRANRPELRSATAALARLHVDGAAEVDWSAAFAGRPVRPTDLPTYPFQRQRHWLDRPAALAAATLSDAILSDVRGAGEPAHPLLGAAVELADGALALSGRLDPAALPWLADHAVRDTVLLPGTAFVDLVLTAGRRAGAPLVEELALTAPLVLPAAGAIEIQVIVAAAQPSAGQGAEGGRRAVTVYSRPDATRPGPDAAPAPWHQHATGFVRTTQAPIGETAGDAALGGAWPPPGAVALDVDDLYPRLAGDGYQYGPAFRGLRAAWRLGDDILADVVLPASANERAEGFAVHPALLDAALHAVVGLLPATGGDTADAAASQSLTRLPFTWNDVALTGTGTGTGALRVRVAATGSDRCTLTVADEAGGPVATIGGLTLRPVATEALLAAGRRVAGPADEGLYLVDWPAVPHTGTDSGGARARDAELDGAGSTYGDRVVLGDAAAFGLPAAGDLAALRATVDAGGRVPTLVVHQHRSTPAGSADGPVDGPVEAAHATARDLLRLLRDWLADERFAASRLVVVTERAVATGPGEDVEDLAAAGGWGLVRSAHTENPARVALLDVDGRSTSREAVTAALALLAASPAAHSELAVRDGEIRRPLLAPLSATPRLVVPAGTEPWRLDVTSAGSLDDLALLPEPAARRTLGPGEVRVALRAAGLNFRDVLIGLGMYPGGARIGAEGAGVVVEVGADVTDLVPGDRVMGLVQGTLGPLAVTDRRLVTAIPPGWSFGQAAGVPVAFLTAYHGLVGLGGLRAGESVLIHAATGGVGQAAVQLARQLGAEVFGTASPAKWPVLRRQGLDEAHLGSSRTLEFADLVRATTGGRGVDVVLNALAGEFTDASLGLLGAGGRFVEMGKTDQREPDAVAARWPGVTYQAFDLFDVDPARIAVMLADLATLFARGALRPLPTTAWDIRHAPQALRQLSLARHTGKLVLTLPTPLDPAGTVLVTGGTGALGALTARRLVTHHGVCHLLLASRGGPDAPGVAALRAELAELGATATVVAADVSDRADVRRLLAAVPAEHPLSAIVHTAGVLEDAVVTSLDEPALDRVLRPKVDGAWALHEATAGLDLAAFVLFSSVAGLVGNAGQANYAAANAFADALAHHRRAGGLPAVALAWGHWAEAGGMAGALAGTDLARMARTGIAPMSTAQGLDLFDRALAAGGADPLLVTARLDAAAAARSGRDPGGLLDGLAASRRAAGGAGAVPGRGSDPVGAAGQATASTGGGARPADRVAALLDRLRDRPAEEQHRTLLTLVRSTAAEVLGHATPAAIRPDRGFLESAFDSLSAIELRNRLARETGVRLPTTLLFDHPTPTILAAHLRDTLVGAAPAGTAELDLDAEISRLETALSGPLAASPPALDAVVRLHALLARVAEAAGATPSAPAPRSADEPAEFTEQVADATDDEIFDLLDRELGLT
ncbi:Spectinabilin polyketide synthase system protein NorB [Frankia sp. AgKG'84/4]